MINRVEILQYNYITGLKTYYLKTCVTFIPGMFYTESFTHALFFFYHGGEGGVITLYRNYINNCEARQAYQLN